MDLLQRLEEAARSKETLVVVYYGGSQPGTKRRLVPIKVTPREVRARDVATRSVKNFLVSKLEVVAEDHAARDYNPGRVPEPESADLVEALEPTMPELQTLGWHVELSEFHVSVHRFFKNGKPRKGADAGILKRDEVASRPWYVWGPDLASARTYSRLGKAVELFLDQARAHSPRS